MTHSSVRFGIIGCGRIAQRHAQHITNNGQLIATLDVKPDKAEALAQTYNAAFYTNLDTFLSENQGKMDVVSVCSPNGLHAQHTIAALKAGFHVLCEKPMAISVEDCGRMINEAERANRRLFIVKQNRFNPANENKY